MTAPATTRAFLRPPVLSPFYRSRAGTVPHLFIVHSTRSGGEHDDETERAGTLSWFRNPQSGLSAHFVGDASGGLTQVVPLDQAAQHAGWHNPISIGIELTQPRAEVPYTEGHYQAAALAFHLANTWLAEHGHPAIPAVRVASAQDPGIIGHEDSEQGKSAGKSDPGGQFHWDHFLAVLRSEA